MSCIYHLVPHEMRGTVLYPLNQLEQIDTRLYGKAKSKYMGRESVMYNRIPQLGNCLWNDVLFFSAVHPAFFREAFASVGYIRTQPFRAYAFEIESLDHSRIAVLLHKHKNAAKDYEPFNPTRLQEYATIPPATFKYWREAFRTGVEHPLLFMHIPHILYRGSLDTNLATVVEG